jgi:YbbR domain-containing protein
VVRLNPGQVTMELERITTKTVPVRLRLVGKLPADLQVVETKISPETVQVSGPTSDVENVHAASTESVDLSKMQPGTIERELPLDPAGDYVAFSASRVAAQLRIDEVSATREFKAQPIRIRNAAQTVSIIPSTVRLVVRGPKRLVGSFELGENAVSVDASQLSAGENTIKPLVELPEGIEEVSVEPAQVRVVIGTQRPKRR